MMTTCPAEPVLKLEAAADGALALLGSQKRKLLTQNQRLGPQGQAHQA